MLKISTRVSLPLDEIQFEAIRAQGAGGQNVNKVSSAIHLRFDIRRSSLPEVYKERLLALHDRRINRDGIVVIKAQQFRSQDKNRAAALERLAQLIRAVGITAKPRKTTRPTRASKRKRLDKKTRDGRTKTLRGKVQHDD
ncbi:MAG TPA: aminoacyl-tRNA hydrolase [Chromatiaceae bacterium]|jgi:ribosome-associated protein|nr:aminoacyl-tRNA hydrolase [Chromatiaceae bacterium]HIN82057.1 aminoacyl-tRNA hydrolase [Chromatiales bacterium]HIA08299.1 aminoacyl-tRNA hydrolase [Chromatiaceae bacterium]HIB83509.1 aminoacyl-tRNA hydrolase [Chromatiaceae bacterium]HIO15069.1 aminoacyl-tRNA hydrolase [Chromatiales bacterium]